MFRGPAGCTFPEAIGDQYYPAGPTPAGINQETED
jgi:hypothetical protein